MSATGWGLRLAAEATLRRLEAEGLLTRAPARVVLIDAGGTAVEFGPGEIRPRALWHCPASSDAQWRRVPAPTDDRLAVLDAALAAWMAASPAERASDTVLAAERALAEASGLTVVPASLLPAAIEAGRPLLAGWPDRASAGSDSWQP